MQTFTTLHADAERQFPVLERQLEDARAVVALYRACVVRDPRDTESVFVDSDLRNAAESAEKTIRIIEQGLATLASRRSRNLKPLIQQSNILKGAAVALGVAMVAAFAPAVIAALPMLFTLGAIAIAVDELITMWEGGDTIIGRVIDHIFGAGSAQKAVAWVKGVVKSTGELVTDTERALNDFDGGLRLMWFDLTTWLGKQWADLGTGAKLVLFDLESAVPRIVASIEDSFAKLWNGILTGAMDAVASVSNALNKIPGASALLEKVGGAIASAKASTDHRLNADTAAVQGRGAIMAAGEQDQAAIAAQRATIMDRATANVAAPAGPANVSVTNQTIVNVPAGTSAQTARAVGDAAAKGAKDNLATYRALVPTAG